MKLMFIFAGVLLLNSIQCYDSGSFESSYNGLGLPFYDTIIFSDIADIMKEFESSNIPFDKHAKDDSESDENIEDLLLEYHKYLEKEQKQRKEYVERNKLKNKVPLLRHERFSKTSFGNGGKYNDYLYKNGYYNLDTYKSNNPLDLFVPVHQKINYLNTIKPTTALPRDSMELNTFEKSIRSDDSSFPLSFSKFPFKEPCCRNGLTSCKQCVTAKDFSRNRIEPRVSMYSDEKKLGAENSFVELPDLEDALNIRIKVDVQLPKLHERSDKHQNTFDLNDGSNTKDFPLAIKMPTSYYNFPIPMNLFGYKRMSKLNSSPLHKLTIHKKKKTKSSTGGGKKHRKKIITFHNIKLEPQQIFDAHFGKTPMSKSSLNNNYSTVTPDLSSRTSEILETSFSSTTSAPFEKINTTDTQTEENVLIVVNISNNAANETDEYNKTNNSIESDYTDTVSNATTENTLHLIKKREVVKTNKAVTVPKTVQLEVIALNKTVSEEERHVSNMTKHLANKDSAKKMDKSLPSEEELLYWPNKNGSQSKVVSKNITTILLESESKRVKLNMTKDTMRKNHTRALEKAIFGDIDWNDVDAVAPAFVSFIGKYIEGILTFCSDVICHSMKCGQKVCNHRVCKPMERFNNKGHCMGANITDSVATMESIMDLPSNVGFEIVDILQDKMAGKLFGKVTLCISSKCITFAASKKMFIKYKCIVKEVNPKGHCVNSKEGKVA